jgi:type IV pilus assembly protein PilM
MKLPSKLPAMNLKGGLNLGHRSSSSLVGLDIQPGFVAAVGARVNGSILAEHAASLPLPADAVRDGEVMDPDALSDVLRELFGKSGFSKHVRIGIANQRTVLRLLELPPVTDEKELAAAVTFQAQDQVPMPLNNAVLDFHPLGVIDTPAGPRQRVVLVAAQRDMVERLIAAVRQAGLSPEGVDLSAFALIRSLYRPEPEQTGRVLYLNVDGLTNLAIAEGKVCRFTRVVGSGLEGMASELAARRGIALTEARTLLAAVDLTAQAPGSEAPSAPEIEEHPIEAPEAEAPAADTSAEGPAEGAALEAEPSEESTEQPPEEAALSHEESEEAMSYEELAALPAPPEPVAQPASESDVWMVLENGIREISGEVRNSLDFHRSQDGGGDVSHVVLSGAAQDIPGFADALHAALGVEVRSAQISVSDSLERDVSPHRLAVATGLAALEAPQ